MDNPYRPPDASLIQTGGGGSGPSGLGEDWDAFQVLQIAWDRLRENPGVLVGAGAVVFGINIAFTGFNQLIAIGLPLLMRSAGEAPPAWIGLVTLPITIASMLVQFFLTIGMARIALGSIRGEQVSVGMLFSGLPWALPVLGGSIVIGLGTTLGCCLLVAPGIILALGTCVWMYLVIDRDMGAFDAFQASWQITDGEKMKLFVLGLVGLILVIIVTTCTCSLGAIGTTPYISLCLALVYDHLSRTKLPAAA